MDLLRFILSCSLVCLSYFLSIKRINENGTHGSVDVFSLHSQLVLARVALNSAARHGSPLTRGTADCSAFDGQKLCSISLQVFLLNQQLSTQALSQTRTCGQASKGWMQVGQVASRRHGETEKDLHLETTLNWQLG